MARTGSPSPKAARTPAPPAARARAHALAVSLALALAVGLTACRTPAGAGLGTRPVETRAAVEAVLRAQEAAWNRRDIAEFMALGYWRSADLTFFSGGETSRGYQPMLERYVAKYQAPGQDPGRLAFTRLEIVPLAEGVALARGRWDLDFEVQADVGGLFTLVLRETTEGWRIVHDHTSVDG